jgi:phosphoribosylaminoimidazole-succinocarboxamide synthase
MRTSLFEPFVEIDLPLPDRRDGKIRSSWDCGDDRRLIVTTDRLSAFDRVLGGVAYKGQVLNQLSAWWFDATADIIDNHVISVPDPNALLARTASPLTVEVIVRGYITGVTDTSIWGMYSTGAREMYGYRFAEGLEKNTSLKSPIVTPTTKATAGGHDEPLSCADVVEFGHVDAASWDRVVDSALALFERGAAIGREAGLILADTKYEFGMTSGNELLLIDELHTPDSSRWWVADNYEHRRAEGAEPESLDKEVVRRAFADLGYKGDGPIPIVDDAVWSATAARYISAAERLMNQPFVPAAYPVAERLTENLSKAGLL